MKNIEDIQHMKSYRIFKIIMDVHAQATHCDALGFDVEKKLLDEVINRLRVEKEKIDAESSDSIGIMDYYFT